MSTDQQPPSPKLFERVMVFVDSGYLRKLCMDCFGHDNIDFRELRRQLIQNFNEFSVNPFQADLIRIYYYDAIVEEGHPDYKAQREYFDDIEDRYSFTVKLGTLVESSNKKFKQKGVDILMAIDALVKAYQGHYDTGVFLAGDRDFLPLIEAVKDTGKKTFCISHLPTCSPDLLRCFDYRVHFDKEDIDTWLKK